MGKRFVASIMLTIIISSHVFSVFSASFYAVLWELGIFT